jgi:hypothetical protein
MFFCRLIVADHPREYFQRRLQTTQLLVKATKLNEQLRIKVNNEENSD